MHRPVWPHICRDPLASTSWGFKLRVLPPNLAYYLLVFTRLFMSDVLQCFWVCVHTILGVCLQALPHPYPLPLLTLVVISMSIQKSSLCSRKHLAGPFGPTLRAFQTVFQGEGGNSLTREASGLIRCIWMWVQFCWNKCFSWQMKISQNT